MTEINQMEKEVRIPAGDAWLSGDLVVPTGASGIVVFAHGSGSSRKSTRNQYVAGVIREAGLGTLLFDLLTPEEESVDMYTRQFRFDIGLLSKRLVWTARWLKDLKEAKGLEMGLFGASTGAAAALIAAAELGRSVGAVVSRGGRPDLAGGALDNVLSPTLLIVGELDDVVIGLNREAFGHLHCIKELMIVPGATHLFEEKGALGAVAKLAADWFGRYLGRESKTAAGSV